MKISRVLFAVFSTGITVLMSHLSIASSQTSWDLRAGTSVSVLEQIPVTPQNRVALQATEDCIKHAVDFSQTTVDQINGFQADDSDTACSRFIESKLTTPMAAQKPTVDKFVSEIDLMIKNHTPATVDLATIAELKQTCSKIIKMTIPVNENLRHVPKSCYEVSADETEDANRYWNMQMHALAYARWVNMWNSLSH